MKNMKRRIKNLAKNVESLSTMRSRPERLDIASEIEANLFIRPKQGGLSRIRLKPFQRKIIDTIQSNRDNEKPTRLIILKSRQLGCSTAIQATLFTLCLFLPQRSAQTIAHRKDSSRKIFRMSRRFYNSLPPELKIPVEGGKVMRDKIEYSWPHDSEISVYTAGGEDVGRGETVHYCHWSETAFWPNSEEIYDALIQAVPPPTESWDTMVVVESTANGQNNLFHSLWKQADAAQDTIWQGLFFSWKDDPTARMSVATNERFNPTQDELDFQLKHGLNAEQLKWARYVRTDQCRGSWEKFHQEYPVSPELAFTFSGYPWFDPSIIKLKIDEARETSPAFTGFIEFAAQESLMPRLRPDQLGPINIWEHPQPKSSYCIGADISEGVGADYTEIMVVKEDPLKLVAQFRSNRIKPTAAGLLAYLLGAYYHWALVAIERNGPGLATLAILEFGLPDYPQTAAGYPNLYYQIKMDQKLIDETPKLGFPTTRKSKVAALNRLSEAIHQETFAIPSRSFLFQADGFKWDPMVRNWLETNTDPVSNLKNDDAIMALAIAVEVIYQQMPRHFMARTLIPITNW